MRVVRVSSELTAGTSRAAVPGPAAASARVSGSADPLAGQPVPASPPV